jgi:hypothetical protein
MRHILSFCGGTAAPRVVLLAFAMCAIDIVGIPHAFGILMPLHLQIMDTAPRFPLLLLLGRGL